MSSILLSLWILAAAPVEDVATLARTAAALAADGKFAEARTALEKARRLAPKDASVAFNLAQVQEADGKLADAIASYEAYLALAPRAADAADVQARLARLRSATADVPDEARQKLLKGQRLFESKRFDDAAAALLEAEQLAPNWGAPQFNLGVTYEAMGRFEDARERFTRYLPLAPASERAQLNERLVDLEIKADDARKKAGAAGATSLAAAPPGKVNVTVRLDAAGDHNLVLDVAIDQQSGNQRCAKPVSWLATCALQLDVGPARLTLSGPDNVKSIVDLVVLPSTGAIVLSGRSYNSPSMLGVVFGVSMVIVGVAVGVPLAIVTDGAGAAVLVPTITLGVLGFTGVFFPENRYDYYAVTEDGSLSPAPPAPSEAGST